MLGAISGDVIGSIYEKNNIKTKIFSLFGEKNRFTDDSVMTCAISAACCDYYFDRDINHFRENCIYYMQKMGVSHINAGYGQTFIYWLISKNPQPYGSYGNGSAMRVSPVAYVSETLEEAETLAEISASVSHNHFCGIQGAKAVASAIWLLKNGSSKEVVKKHIESKYYELNFKLDEIRNKYGFDVSCQGSVPQAIVSFLESNGFEDAIRNAISLGGDSDTIAAITGSLAEAYYGIPEHISSRVIGYLDDELFESVRNFYKIIYKNSIKEK